MRFGHGFVCWDDMQRRAILRHDVAQIFVEVGEVGRLTLAYESAFLEQGDFLTVKELLLFATNQIA